MQIERRTGDSQDATTARQQDSGPPFAFGNEGAARLAADLDTVFGITPTGDWMTKDYPDDSGEYVPTGGVREFATERGEPVTISEHDLAVLANANFSRTIEDCEEGLGWRMYELSESPSEKANSLYYGKPRLDADYPVTVPIRIEIEDLEMPPEAAGQPVTRTEVGYIEEADCTTDSDTLLPEVTAGLYVVTLALSHRDVGKAGYHVTVERWGTEQQRWHVPSRDLTFKDFEQAEEQAPELTDANIDGDYQP